MSTLSLTVLYAATVLENEGNQICGKGMEKTSQHYCPIKSDLKETILEDVEVLGNTVAAYCPL